MFAIAHIGATKKATRGKRCRGSLRLNIGKTLFFPAKGVKPSPPYRSITSLRTMVWSRPGPTPM